MGPKHAGHGDGDHDGPGGRGGGRGDHDGPGGRGGQGQGQGQQGGGGDAPDVRDRVKRIKDELEVLKEHDHIKQDDIEKIMRILPNHA